MWVGKIERGSMSLVWEQVPGHAGREMPLRSTEHRGTEEKTDGCWGMDSRGDPRGRAAVFGTGIWPRQQKDKRGPT